MVRSAAMNAGVQIHDVQHRDGLLTVRISGAWVRESAEEFHLRLISLAEEHGAEFCLLDAEGLRGSLSVTDAYYVVEGLARAGARRLKRIAVIRRDSDRNGTRFFETAAQNRGINLCFFPTRGSAEDWLDDAVDQLN